MNPMFNEYKDAGKIQEALLIGRNMVNKAPGDSECVNAYLDFLLMLAEKLPRTDERKSFADQANLVLSFYEENADLTDDIINDIYVYHNRLGAVVTDIAQLEQVNIEKITKVSPHSAKIDLSIAIVVFIVKYNYRKLQMRIGECCKTFVKNSQERCSA